MKQRFYEVLIKTKNHFTVIELPADDALQAIDFAVPMYEIHQDSFGIDPEIPINIHTHKR